MNEDLLKSLTRQAAEWRLVSLLMSRPHGDCAREVKSLSNEMLDADLLQAAALAWEIANEEDYLKLFGPSGRISPREVAYIGMEDPGLTMSDLMNFYQSFHFTPQAEDPGDHIAVQSGFAGYLTLKEAYAHASEQSEAAVITHAALEHFYEKHLGRLIRGIASKLEANDPPYFRIAVEYLLQRIRHIPDESVMISPNQTTEPLQCAIQGNLCDES